MIYPKQYKKILWLVLFLIGLSGCGKELGPLSLAPTDAIESAVIQDLVQPERGPEEKETHVPQTEPRTERAAVVPTAYRLLPASDREVVFDTLLGPKQDAYFLQEHRGETFIVFNEEGMPVRMAHARRLGGKEGSILILLGMSVSPQMASLERIYTFEWGTTAAVKPYLAGKDSFLKQFQDPRVFDKSSKIHGITGATPIWKPVAEQIQQIRETLLKAKADAEWIAAVKSQGHFWQRSDRRVADGTNGDSNPTLQEQPQITDVSVVQDSNSPHLSSSGEMQNELVLEGPGESGAEAFLTESTPNTILYEHWKMIAVAEVSLLVCGLLIVITTQIKRTVYP